MKKLSCRTVRTLALTLAAAMIVPAMTACEKQESAPRLVETVPISDDAAFRCPSCKGAFKAGETRRLRPNSLEVKCPRCGRVIVPKKA